MKMHVHLAAAVLAMGVATGCGTAMAGVALPEPKVALVIGNENYDYKSAVPLLSPGNDAVAVGAAFERLGFTVRRLVDAGYVDMLDGLVKFARDARGAQAAVVFYAGHGLAVDGRNFLLPVDMSRAVARAAGSGELYVTEGNAGWIPLEWMIRSVEGASILRIVIVDGDVGAPLEEPASGTLVALAGEIGTPTIDSVGGGEGDNSPYTEALLRYLEEPGIELGMLFRKVRAEVMGATEDSRHIQTPALYGSLPGREVYLLDGEGVPVEFDPDLYGSLPVRARGGLHRVEEPHVEFDSGLRILRRSVLNADLLDR